MVVVQVDPSQYKVARTTCVVWRVHPAVRIRHQVTLTLRFPATCRWTPRGTQVLWIHIPQ